MMIFTIVVVHICVHMLCFCLFFLNFLLSQGIRRVIQAPLSETSPTSSTIHSFTTGWSPSTTNYVSSGASGGVTGILVSVISSESVV